MTDFIARLEAAIGADLLPRYILNGLPANYAAIYKAQLTRPPLRIAALRTREGG
ncbi:hypothetical protein [Synechococcus phage Yong-M3-232]|nr:hypothetical protein [Synechococcus phage Yong-M3-232]